jgi:hypothetical protein
MTSEPRGYFNALTSGYFKTTEDGRRLFYPWGVLGRGYVIPSAEAYGRLHRRITIYQIVAMVLVVGAVAGGFYIAAFVIAALLIGFYVAWTSQLLRGLERSEERLSFDESMATRARAFGAGWLWFLEGISLLFVAAGVGMLFTEPGQWPVALASTAFFAFCAAMIARMLVLRRRGAGRAS